MSYTAIPTSISRSSSPSNSDRESSIRDSPSSGSEIPLLPTASYSHDSQSKEVEDLDGAEYAWSSNRKQRERGGKRRTLVVALLAPLVVFTLLGLAYLSNGTTKVSLEKVPSWIKDHFKSEREVRNLLVPRVNFENGTLFSYYPAPLTNPVFPQWNLDIDHDLSIELLPKTVQASTSSSLIFHCAHANLTYCAEAYRVVFMGPTMHSPAWSDSTQLDERRVEVKFNISDPGDYQIYAWPEHDNCRPFQPELHDWKIHFLLAVDGTPATITVDGPPPVDATRACTLEDDLTDGRWISRKHINPEHLERNSPLYNWVESHLDPLPTSLKTLTDYRKYNYIFANYKCKVLHRPFESYVNEIKPDRLLFLGDSVTRDQMCLNYGVADQARGACMFERWDAPYERTDKNVPLVRTSDNGTTYISFHWEPLGDPANTEVYLKAHSTPPPSHIFFEIGLWLTERSTSPQAYVDSIRPYLQALLKLAPNASIMTRTTASAVQPIACYDRKHIQRRVLEPVNRAFVSFMREEFPQVLLLDSYKVYDHRPDSSQDGRHWERIESDEKWAKPEEGAVTYAMTDIIFETWRLRGEAERRVNLDRL
ncbi:hypothetical protein JCM3765_003958 [Sporobolomyces pararoseus]